MRSANKVIGGGNIDAATEPSAQGNVDPNELGLFRPSLGFSYNFSYLGT